MNETQKDGTTYGDDVRVNFEDIKGKFRTCFTCNRRLWLKNDKSNFYFGHAKDDECKIIETVTEDDLKKIGPLQAQKCPNHPCINLTIAISDTSKLVELHCPERDCTFRRKVRYVYTQFVQK